jgi:hypothetical protein
MRVHTLRAALTVRRNWRYLRSAFRMTDGSATATSAYLGGIDTAEIIDTGHNRRPPMISASAGLMI